MIIDWPGSFDSWLGDLDSRAAQGDGEAITVRQLVYRQLDYLQQLPEAPTEDTVSLKQVRQARKHPVWRLSHPYVPGHAVRTIVWFPEAGRAVVVLFANDKAQMGDVFFDSVGSRADQIVDEWIRNSAPERP